MAFASGQTLQGSSLEARLAALESPPFCELAATAVQSIAVNQFVQLAMGQKVEDTLGTMADLPNSAIIIKRAGLYRVSGQLTYPFNATGTRGLFISKNGTYLASSTVKAGDADATRLQVNRTFRCALNDTLKIYTYVSTALNTDGTPYGGTWFSAEYVGT